MPPLLLCLTPLVRDVSGSLLYPAHSPCSPQTVQRLRPQHLPQPHSSSSPRMSNTSLTSSTPTCHSPAINAYSPSSVSSSSLPSSTQSAPPTVEPRMSIRSGCRHSLHRTTRTARCVLWASLYPLPRTALAVVTLSNTMLAHQPLHPCSLQVNGQSHNRLSLCCPPFSSSTRNQPHVVLLRWMVCMCPLVSCS